MEVLQINKDFALGRVDKIDEGPGSPDCLNVISRRPARLEKAAGQRALHERAFRGPVQSLYTYYPSDDIKLAYLLALAEEREAQRLISVADGVMRERSASIATPTLLGSAYDYSGVCGCTHITVQGDYAFTADYVSGWLMVIDISNPNNPTLVSGVSSSEYLSGARGIAVRGNYAYVACYTAKRVTVVDISNPKEMQIVGSVYDTLLDGAFGVYLRGSYLYVACYNSDSLAAVDISNPATPVIVGSVTSAAELTGACQVDVQDDYAYVTAMGANRLTIVDISNPTAPFIKGSVQSAANLGGAYGVTVRGNYAYVVAYGADCLTVVDVADPANPKIWSSIATTAYLDDPTKVVLQGNYAYITAHESDCLTIVDVSDPANLSIAAALFHPDLDGASGLTVDGNYAYTVSCYSHMISTVDVSHWRVVKAGLSTTAPVSFATTVNYLAGCDGANKPFKYDGLCDVSNLENAPEDSKLFILHKEKLFAVPASDPSTALFSDSFLLESWPGVNYLNDFGKGDGDTITVWRPYEANLLVFKTYSIYELMGTSLADFRIRKRSSNVGAVGPNAVTADETGTYLYFIAKDGIYRWYQEMIVNLTKDVIPFLWEAVNQEYIHLASAAWFGGLGRFCLPVYGSEHNNLLLIYDPAAKTFWPWTRELTCFAKLGEGAREVLYAGGTGNHKGLVLQQDVGFDDCGEPIHSMWVSSRHGGAQKMKLHMLHLRDSFGLEDAEVTCSVDDDDLRLFAALGLPDLFLDFLKDAGFLEELHRRYRFGIDSGAGHYVRLKIVHDGLQNFGVKEALIEYEPREMR